MKPVYCFICRAIVKHPNQWKIIELRIGVVVITTEQLHSTKPELRFCGGSNPARSMGEICDSEDL